MQEMTIDIVSDVACPWCVIGYKNLEQALQDLSDQLSVTVNWHAFELRPDSPLEGENWREHIMQKYGMSYEQSEESRKRISHAGEQVGFRFNFTDDMKTQNTFNCHRLLSWAKDSGQQTALKLALFEAYFTERSNVNDPAVLKAAATRAGLDAQAAADILASDAYADEVRGEEAHYQQLGVQSVPTFIINNQYAITGGQPADTFKQALTQIAAEMAVE